MQVEARGLNLGRTSWHYDEVDVRPQRARRRLGGARVLATKLRVEPCPTFRRAHRNSSEGAILLKQKMSADTGVEIELTSDFIANNFVEQYYAAIHKDPELVRKFYGADSTSSKEEPILGADLIHEKIVSLGLQGGLACIQHLVAQSSAEGIVIMVVGTFARANESVCHPFRQTFILGKMSPDDSYAFYLRNNIFAWAAESAPPAATTSSSAPSRVDQRPKEWSYGVFCRSVHSTIHDAAKLSPFFAQFGEVKSISCRDHGSRRCRLRCNAMVTFTSQAAASFALKSFEEKPDIFTLEGKPDAGAGKPVRIEELKTFTERYPGGAPAGGHRAG
ncbi:hypothetical protein EMIHUDRAFT_241880 [Emiliania huxleyi CCMP1516]|uniref:NTF2 domain-containing protein n=2 Tax=Emiliania huxleyi TaxID=2903 RepID=A0A0D3JB59_EMIH1|nr:hypothetical protein EMIHUDRAFT_241880 [Emiliania huxleyi CCMP1516]EOD20744.1 hypothetical protein EMIHUDRAFT_241880 [Emiliania huxleyi CCMP1516]|eukprot:XP_005773173.1 hypothetical protein EMIHUDRAFT_241880 [Emiliania huxleyi CCMP1516]